MILLTAEYFDDDNTSEEIANTAFKNLNKTVTEVLQSMFFVWLTSVTLKLCALGINLITVFEYCTDCIEIAYLL